MNISPCLAMCRLYGEAPLERLVMHTDLQEDEMGQFNLIVQHPKPQKPVHGVLSMDKRGEAQFFTGNGEADSRIVGTLERTRVEHAASNGILISGVERVGNKLRFQEWWLVYA